MINIVHKLSSLLSVFYTLIIKHKFANFGKSKLYINTLISNPAQISIKDNTVIRKGSWLLAIKSENSDSIKIDIGSNVYFGHNLHLTAINKVIIEDDVLIADKVFISDNNHDYINIDLPIKHQQIILKGKVKISSGAWLGENVCVIGCNIGKNAIVAANSVVLKDVPDYSIVGGNPARMIKKYNIETKKWQKTNPKGEFIDE